MDPQVGQGPLGLIEDGDVLLDADRVVAVGSDLRADNDDTRVIEARGKIVMPGFVDLHTHLWQSLIRGCGTDSELNGWLAACVLPLFVSPVSDADAYAGGRLSSLDVISTGVTTVVDFSHAFNADFARGNLRAPTDSRLRFVFAYFVGSDPEVVDEVRRFKRELIDPDPLAALQIGSHPSTSDQAAMTAGSELARELNVALNVHLLESPADRAEGRMEALRQAGALRPGLLANHVIHVTDAELDELAAADVRVAHNPLSNMRLASGIIRLPAMRVRNIKTGWGRTVAPTARYPTPSDVLRMATLGGAEALGVDGQIGSLTPGKKADLQIIDPCR